MRARWLPSAVLAAVALLTASSAGAAHWTGRWPPPGGTGVKIYSTGGPAEVHVLSATAAFESLLYIASPGPRRFVASNRDVGDVVQLGEFPEGAEVVFEIEVLDTGNTFATGPGERNPDGEPHAAAEEHVPGEVLVGFEDIHADDGSDMDYDDNVFQFTGSLTLVVPPPPLETSLDARPAVAWLIPSVGVFFPQLSARLTETESMAPIVGRTIRFHSNRFGLGDGGVLCTAVTDANGVASCGTAAEAIEAVGGLGYDAIFDGDPQYVAVRDRGTILRVGGIDIL